jgi:hypothetical protein
MTTLATNQSPYRMNFTAKFRPMATRVVSRRVDKTRYRPVPWRTIAVLFVMGTCVANWIVLERAKLESRHAPRNAALANLHVVAEGWRLDHHGECPTVQRLVDEKELSAKVDVSGYEIACLGNETFIARGMP